MRRVVVTALVAVSVLLGPAAPALAHNSLASSDPAEGASFDTAPDKATLEFDQEVQSGDVNQVVVTGPDGKSVWSRDKVTVDRNVVSVPLAPLGPAGEYSIGYRVLSADGHPVSGEINFTLEKAGDGEPVRQLADNDGRQSERQDSGGIPVWIWIVGAVALLAAGLVLALRLGKEQE